VKERSGAGLWLKKENCELGEAVVVATVEGRKGKARNVKAFLYLKLHSSAFRKELWEAQGRKARMTHRHHVGLLHRFNHPNSLPVISPCDQTLVKDSRSDITVN